MKQLFLIDSKRMEKNILTLLIKKTYKEVYHEMGYF